MKICFLVHNYNATTGFGVDRYSFELIKRINKKFNISVITQGEFTTPYSWLKKEIIFQFKGMKIKGDLYHATSQANAKTALLFKKRPLVVTIHDLIFCPKSLTSFYVKDNKPSLRNNLNYAYMNFCTQLASQSDKFIVPFEITKQDLINTFKICPEKIRIVNYGVDLNLFRPIQKNDNALVEKKANKNIILFVGGGIPAKGCDTLIKSFSLVAKQSDNCELWIIGRFNVFNIEKLTMQLGVFDKVKFLGYVSEEVLPLYYNIADVFVYPSKIGFGLQILEAMACAKPVITSDTADISEIVADATLLVHPLDINRIASLIAELLDNNRQREDLGAVARRRAELFPWDETAKKTEEVYLELI